MPFLESPRFLGRKGGKAPITGPAVGSLPPADLAQTSLPPGGPNVSLVEQDGLKRIFQQLNDWAKMLLSPKPPLSCLLSLTLRGPIHSDFIAAAPSEVVLPPAALPRSPTA